MYCKLNIYILQNYEPPCDTDTLDWGNESRTTSRYNILGDEGKDFLLLSTHDMSSPNFGVMGPFDPSAENCISYEERFRLYLTANEVTSDEKKQAVFLTTCGTSTYNLFRSLAAPRKPPELSFAELVKLAAGHYHPEPSQAVQRLKFFSRSRHAGESVATFFAELKRLSEHCNFGDALEDMLRDRLVCGIQDQ